MAIAPIANEQSVNLARQGASCGPRGEGPFCRHTCQNICRTSREGIDAVPGIKKGYFYAERLKFGLFGQLCPQKMATPACGIAIHALIYLSNRNFSGSVTLKSTARSRKFCAVMVCSLSGRMASTLVRISAAFSTVCIRPKVMSKSGPEQNMP